LIDLLSIELKLLTDFLFQVEGGKSLSSLPRFYVISLEPVYPNNYAKKPVYAGLLRMQ
jgi:hypothetical protein